MKFEIIKDVTSLKAIEFEWRDLSKRVPNHTLFQTFDWLLCGWHFVGSKKGHELYVVVARQEKRAVLIWPLEVYSHFAWRIASWIGPKTHAYGDILVEQGPQTIEWIEAAWKFLTSQSAIDAVLLWNVRRDSNASAFFSRSNIGVKEFDSAPIVDWGDWSDWSSYYSSLNKKFRQDQRRQKRRLCELGTLEVEVAQTETEVEQILNWTIQHKSAWLKHVGKPGHRVEPEETQAFLRAVIRHAHNAGSLNLAALKLNGKVIATDLGFFYNGRQYGWIGTYDLDWAPYSPSRLLIDASLERAYKKGIKIFDFMPSRSSYKFNWAKKEETIFSFLGACSPWGKIYSAWFGGSLRRLAKQLYGGLPKGLRRFLAPTFLR